MSSDDIIPAVRFDDIPIKDELDIGHIMHDIEKVFRGETDINDRDFKQRAEEMLDKLQKTSDWLFKLRQIERTKINELQGSMLNKMKALFKGSSTKAQLDKLDQKINANRELTELYGEIIIHLEDLLKRYPQI